IVDEYIDSFVLAYDLRHKVRHGLEVGYVKCPDIDAIRHPSGFGRFVQTAATGNVPHARNHVDFAFASSMLVNSPMPLEAPVTTATRSGLFRDGASAMCSSQSCARTPCGCDPI